MPTEVAFLTLNFFRYSISSPTVVNNMQRHSRDSSLLLSLDSRRMQRLKILGGNISTLNNSPINLPKKER